MKKLFLLFSTLFLTAACNNMAIACCNPPPPPICPEPNCEQPLTGSGSSLVWVIDNWDCPNNQVTVRFKNLSTMASDPNHTCTCALGAASDVFSNVESFSFVLSGSNTPFASFNNWNNINTNVWNTADGFDGNYNIATFTTELADALPEGQSLDIIAVLNIDSINCSIGAIRDLLDDVKIGVDEWDTETSAPAQSHQAIGQAVETCTCPPEYLGKERAEMIKLRDALNLDPFEYSSWYSDIWASPPLPLSKWKGVYASGDCYVFKIDLSCSDILGTLPQSLDLPYLIELNLSHNHIAGCIPEYELYCLEELYLNDNLLCGYLPTFNGLPSLKILELQNNYTLTGYLPTLENSPMLMEFNASSNCILGELPDYNHDFLWKLHLSENKLTGAVPNFDLPALVELHLDNNCLDDLPNAFTEILYLEEIKLHVNKFDFDDLEPLVILFNHPFDPFKPAIFTYEDQALVYLGYANFKLSAFAGGTLAINTYSWYKDSTLQTTPFHNGYYTGNNEYMPTSNGIYYASVTNAIVTGLTLNTILVNVFDISPNLVNQIAFKNVFPNPNNGVFTLDLSNNNNTVKSINITDIDGKSVYNIEGKNVNSNLKRIDMSDSPVGIYFIEVQTDTKVLAKQMVIE